MNYICADNFCHKMFEIYNSSSSSILMEMTKAQLSSKGENVVSGKSQKKYGPSWFISFVNSQLFIAGDS